MSGLLSGQEGECVIKISCKGNCKESCDEKKRAQGQWLKGSSYGRPEEPD